MSVHETENLYYKCMTRTVWVHSKKMTLIRLCLFVVMIYSFYIILHLLHYKYEWFPMLMRTHYILLLCMRLNVIPVCYISILTFLQNFFLIIYSVLSGVYTVLSQVYILQGFGQCGRKTTHQVLNQLKWASCASLDAALQSCKNDPICVAALTFTL